MCSYFVLTKNGPRALELALAAKRTILIVLFLFSYYGVVSVSSVVAYQRHHSDGEAAIDAAVDQFYKKVLADERVNRFFEGVDMKRQARMQKAFLTYAFGGPNTYAGRSLKAAHARIVKMGLDDSHFDAILENLGATLAELGVPAEVIAQAASVAEGGREAVLGRNE